MEWDSGRMTVEGPVQMHRMGSAESQLVKLIHLSEVQQVRFTSDLFRNRAYKTSQDDGARMHHSAHRYCIILEIDLSYVTFKECLSAIVYIISLLIGTTTQFILEVTPPF